MYKVFKADKITLGDKKPIVFTQICDNNESEIYLHPQEDNDIYIKNKEVHEKAESQYQQILEEAKIQAQIIIEEAYNDSKKILEKAKQEGYQEGHQEGINQGKESGYEEMESIIAQAKDIKQQVYHTQARLSKEMEGQIIQLVIDCVKKVIQHEIQKDHEILLNLIEKGLEKCNFTESLVIRVSEEDYDLIYASKNRIFMMTEGINEVEVKCDGALNPGSIIIETLSGKIDSGIDTQIKQIEAVFNELLQGEG